MLDESCCLHWALLFLAVFLFASLILSVTAREFPLRNRTARISSSRESRDFSSEIRVMQSASCPLCSGENTHIPAIIIIVTRFSALLQCSQHAAPPPRVCIPLYNSILTANLSSFGLWLSQSSQMVDLNHVPVWHTGRDFAITKRCAMVFFKSRQNFPFYWSVFMHLVQSTLKLDVWRTRKFE